MTTQRTANYESSSYLGNLQAVLNKLRQVELFARLNEEEMRAVAALFEQSVAPGGHPIVRQGGTDTHLYIIRSGRVLARTPDNIYDNIEEAILRSGWIFNTTSFLTGQPNAQAFEAMDTVTVWRVSREGFLKLLQTHPTLRLSINAPILLDPTYGVAEVAPTQGVMGSHTRTDTVTKEDEIILQLKEKGPFKGLSGETIRAILQLREKDDVTAKPGVLIVNRGQNDTKLYVVVEGRLVIREATEKYVDPRREIVNPGGAANEISFMTGRNNYETVEALSNVTLWAIKRENFQEFLKANTELREQIQYSDKVAEILANQSEYKWMQDGEVLMTFARKHPWTFFSASWFGWVALLLLIGVRILVQDGNWLASLLTSPLVGPSLLSIVWWALVGMVIVFLVYQFYDWRNDFYAVTDRRVVHREEVPFRSSTLNEAPIEKIQTVIVNRKTLISNYLNIGEVVMEQMGSEARVIFGHIPSPEKVARQVTLQQQRLSIYAKAGDREKRREQIRKYIELGDRPGDVPSPPRVKENNNKTWEILTDRFLAHGIRKWLGTVWPVSRMEIEGEIVYRKHIFDLFVNASIPFISFGVFALGMLLLWLYPSVISGFLFAEPMIYLVAVIGILLIIWLFYMYEDWRNDFFVLSKDKVIDIDRKPFGFSFSRSEANFDKIQGIKARQIGLINQIINIGDVVITTGSSDQLVWTRVSNPESIQKEIVDRMDAVKKKKEEDKVIDEYRRWAEWIGIYDELARLHEREQLK